MRTVKCFDLAIPFEPYTRSPAFDHSYTRGDEQSFNRRPLDCAGHGVAENGRKCLAMLALHGETLIDCLQHVQAIPFSWHQEQSRRDTRSIRGSDARLYEAAVALRASRTRIFFTVTLPGCRYGLISAAFVVFTLAITDFGAPKVIGGDFNVLATDVYKQVIGQQNFEMGAVVSVVLLIPAVLAFAVDRIVQRRQVALLSSRAVALEPKPNRGFDAAMLGFCVLVSVFLIGMLGVCQYAALVKFYPYDLSFGLQNYDFDLFVNAMTTVSAVVFIYGPDTNLASVAVLNMDDAGDIAPAAVLGSMCRPNGGGLQRTRLCSSESPECSCDTAAMRFLDSQGSGQALVAGGRR